MKKYVLYLSLVVFIIGPAFLDSSGSKQFEITKNLEIFANLYKELNTHYVDEVDPARLMRTGIESMLKTLDPYTNYISESDIESYRYMTDGKYDGIGANIRKMGDYATIVEPFEGGPAIRAGLRAGDMIVAVDGKSAKGKTADEINDILRGYPGTNVILTMRRPNQQEDWDVSVERGEFTVKNVPYYGMIDEEIGYIVLTTFTQNASRNVSNALKKLKEEHSSMKGLVFDLRNNGGGLLREAINVSNIFTPKDEIIVTTKGKIKDRDRIYRSTMQPVDQEILLSVLINRYTASASEIVSGVIQDYDRGIIIGQRSYGKGLVQNTVDLEYNSKLKMTTAKYYIPSGRSIQSVQYDEGEPVDIPDSLRTNFTTRNGRKVLDGGGITPDFKIEDQLQTPIIRFLLDKDLIFHYATHYHQKHPEIGQAVSYTFEEFDDFVEFLQNSALHFQTETEKYLEMMERAAEEENLTSVVSDDLESILAKIEKDKSDDLYQNKQQIIALLEKEIVSRYYFQTGRIEKSLTNDEEIRKAISVMKDETEFGKILQSNSK